ncbi:MAG: 1-phosphatidylinositol 4,5-bisphosphate phosphodiesterase beta-4, variant 2 [Marteilia pararefringens]
MGSLDQNSVIKCNESYDRTSHDLRAMHLKSLGVQESYYYRCVAINKGIRKPSLGSLSFFPLGLCIRIFIFVNKKLSIIETEAIHDIYIAENVDRFECADDMFGNSSMCKQKVVVCYGPSYNNLEKFNLIFEDSVITNEVLTVLQEVVFKKRWSILNLLDLKLKDWLSLLMNFYSPSINMTKMQIFLHYFDSENSFKCLKLLRQNNLTKMHRISLERLNFHIFIKIYVNLSCRREISAFYKSYIATHGKSDRSIESLTSFFSNLNAGESTIENIRSLLKYIPKSAFDLYIIISVILMSFPYAESHIFNNSNSNELDFKLSDYFIRSSHNTYLIDYQFGGFASFQPYRFALLAGCRSVELDVYDSVTETNKIVPIITHTKYLQVTPATLHSVVTAINDTAFIASKFPLILSIENHLSYQGQRIAARMMKEVFGGRIVEENEYKELTRNRELRLSDVFNRIFIKAKRNSGVVSSSSANCELITGGGSGEEQDNPLGDQDNLQQHAKSGALNSPQTEKYDNSSQAQSLHPEFSAIVSHYHSVSYSDLYVDQQHQKQEDKCAVSEIEDPKIDKTIGRGTKNAPTQQHNIVSISENVKLPGINYQKNDSQQTINMNLVAYLSIFSRNSLRVYPKYTRVRSTNYNPFKYLANGVQMIAMNLQTPDRYVKSMQQIFSQNQHKGFILRPRIFRRASNTDFEHVNEGKVSLDITLLSLLQPSPGKLVLTLYAFNQLKKSYDIKVGSAHKRHNSGASGHNSRRWKIFGQKLHLKFDNVKYAESAFLLLEYIIDKNNRYCLLVSLFALREGFSHFILPHVANKEQTAPVVLFANCIMTLSSELCDLKMRRVRLDTKHYNCASDDLHAEYPEKLNTIQSAIHSNAAIIKNLSSDILGMNSASKIGLASTSKSVPQISAAPNSDVKNQVHPESADQSRMLASENQSYSQKDKSKQFRLQIDPNNPGNCHEKIENLLKDVQQTNPMLLDKWELQLRRTQSLMMDDSRAKTTTQSHNDTPGPSNCYHINPTAATAPNSPTNLAAASGSSSLARNGEQSTPKKVATLDNDDIEDFESAIDQLVNEQCSINQASSCVNKRNVFNSL